jgi:hypothetical protein
MDKILNKAKGSSICILPACDCEVAEYGFVCEGHRNLLEDNELKVVVCDNCGSIARIVTPSYVGSMGRFWKQHIKKKYVFCVVCRNCGATKEEEIYSTYLT